MAGRRQGSSSQPKSTPAQDPSWHFSFLFCGMSWVYFFLIKACGHTLKGYPKIYGAREVKIIINIV